VNQVSIIAALGSEFVQLVDIVVFGEKTEQDAPRADERGRFSIPAVLEQATKRRDRADTRSRPVSVRDMEDRIAPGPVASLGDGDSKGGWKSQWQATEAFPVLCNASYFDNGSVLYRC
jgi:hypothetical protein